MVPGTGGPQGWQIRQPCRGEGGRGGRPDRAARRGAGGGGEAAGPPPARAARRRAGGGGGGGGATPAGARGGAGRVETLLRGRAAEGGVKRKSKRLNSSKEE